MCSTSVLVNENQKQSEYEKVRKVTFNEEFLEVAQQHRFMISTYCLVLSSQDQLKEEDIRTTLTILEENVLPLHLCYRKIAGELWFCKRNSTSLDFKILNSKENRDETLFGMMHESFKRDDGPLWRTRLLRSEDAFEDPEEVYNSEFKYKNELQFAFHHGITDGTASYKICSMFLNILNNVIAGDKIDYHMFDSIKLVSANEMNSLMTERREFLKQNPDVFNQVKMEMQHIINQKVLLQEAYPTTHNVENCTKFHERTLTKRETLLLIQLFKSKNVTVHGGFCAIVNWTIVELLQEKKFNADIFEIGTFHAINMRRYWSSEYKNVFGNNVGSIRTIMNTEKDVGTHIWDHALEYTEKLHSYLIEKRSLDEEIYLTFETNDEEADWKKIFKNPDPLQLYFSTSNMGNLAQLLPGTGNHVEIISVKRYTSHHGLNIAMVFSFETFRDRFGFSYCYATKYVHPMLAQKIVNKVFHKLKQLVNTK